MGISDQFFRKLRSHPPTAADTFTETNSKFAPEKWWFPSSESPNFQGSRIQARTVSFREGTFTETNSKFAPESRRKKRPNLGNDRIPIPSIFTQTQHKYIEIRITN